MSLLPLSIPRLNRMGEEKLPKRQDRREMDASYSSCCSKGNRNSGLKIKSVAKEVFRLIYL